MASEKELEKKLDVLLNDLGPEELKQLIQKLTKEYYLSYFSNNPTVNETTFNNLEKLVNTYSGKFNVESYINYCLLLAVNSFLIKYVHKDIDLKAFDVDLINNNESEVTVNLLEKVKEKRRELKELSDKDVPEEDIEEVVNNG